MVIVKRIGILSIAKIQALIWLLSGLVLAVVQAIWFALSPPNSAQFSGISSSDVYWGILMVPLTWCVFGFLTGLFFGWVYNIFASQVGGIELELDEKIPKQEPHLKHGRK